MEEKARRLIFFRVENHNVQQRRKRQWLWQRLRIKIHWIRIWIVRVTGTSEQQFHTKHEKLTKVVWMSFFSPVSPFLFLFLSLSLFLMQCQPNSTTVLCVNVSVNISVLCIHYPYLCVCIWEKSNINCFRMRRLVWMCVVRVCVFSFPYWRLTINKWHRHCSWPPPTTTQLNVYGYIVSARYDAL